MVRAAVECAAVGEQREMIEQREDLIRVRDGAGVGVGVGVGLRVSVRGRDR